MTVYLGICPSYFVIWKKVPSRTRLVKKLYYYHVTLHNSTVMCWQLTPPHFFWTSRYYCCYFFYSNHIDSTVHDYTCLVSVVAGLVVLIPRSATAVELMKQVINFNSKLKKKSITVSSMAIYLLVSIAQKFVSYLNEI